MIYFYLCVGVYACTWIYVKAGGIGNPGTGMTGCCEMPDVLRVELGSSQRPACAPAAEPTVQPHFFFF